MEFGLVIGILGLLAAGAQWVSSRRVEQEHRKLLTSMPDRVAAELSKIVAATPDVANEHREEELGGGAHRIRYADVTDDGHRELLVEYLTGAHALALKIFGWRDFEFEEIGHLGTTAPEPFEVADFDGDGRTEIQTYDVDWSVNLPYVLAPRERVLYRWDGRRFAEVLREKAYTPEELAELKRQHFTDSM